MELRKSVYGLFIKGRLVAYSRFLTFAVAVRANKSSSCGLRMINTDQGVVDETVGTLFYHLVHTCCSGESTMLVFLVNPMRQLHFLLPCGLVALNAGSSVFTCSKIGGALP